MKIRKRITGTYRIDLTHEELAQLSEALTKHTEDTEVSPRVKLLAGVMGLAARFPGVHTVKEES